MNKAFLRLNQVTLVLIYLVVVAGSMVRITGSGMGCPDWPRCFGQWVPPTDPGQLPENYREIYGEKRVKKVEKFAKMLTLIGMGETAEKIKNDPATYQELPFNAGKTWMEYINRLAGFLAGNGVLAIFIWTILKFLKNRRLVLLTTLNLIILTFQAWFGSIVVATNLVPWTITVHMFLALVIIALQIVIIRMALPGNNYAQTKNPQLKALVWIIFIITFYQMFLGTQVREYIDELTKRGLGRESWADHFDWSFFIHRSFSWLVLVLLTYLTYRNWKGDRHPRIFQLYIILAIELLSGVCLAYADLPGFVQVSHLLFASVLFGLLWMHVLEMHDKRLKTTGML